MHYLLDTSICAFFLKGKLNLDKIIKEKGLDNCFIFEISVFELKYGAENSDNPKKSHKAVDKFVKGLTIINCKFEREEKAGSAGIHWHRTLSFGDVVVRQKLRNLSPNAIYHGNLNTFLPRNGWKITMYTLI